MQLPNFGHNNNNFSLKIQSSHFCKLFNEPKVAKRDVANPEKPMLQKDRRTNGQAELNS